MHREGILSDLSPPHVACLCAFHSPHFLLAKKSVLMVVVSLLLGALICMLKHRKYREYIYVCIYMYVHMRTQARPCTHARKDPPRHDSSLHRHTHALGAPIAWLGCTWRSRPPIQRKGGEAVRTPVCVPDDSRRIPAKALL